MLNLSFLDAPHIKSMQRGLDLTWQRMELTAQNVANVNTQNYKAKKLMFEELLVEKLAESKTNLYAIEMRKNTQESKQKLAEEIAAIEPEIRTDNSTMTRIDGNNVDIDHEFLELSKQKLQYDYLVQRISGAYSTLRYAVTEGRG